MFKGVFGTTGEVIGFLLFGKDQKKKQQILNYAKKTIPKLEDVAIKAIEAGAEGAARGAVKEYKQ